MKPQSLTQKTTKRASIGSVVSRKRLSDITNSKAQQTDQSSEGLVNQLLKEKAVLLKLIEERNKIIELSGNELRNIRMNFQKLQIQNLQLARTNSQMLAELNLGKDKLKALQHELVLKEALLKMKDSGVERGQIVAEECLDKANPDIKCSKASNRGGTARSKSMGPSTSGRGDVEKDKSETKRRRRQSAGIRSQEHDDDNMLEIDFENLTAMQHRDNCDSEGEVQAGSRRSSVARPARRAAEKVQSYKEVPLNIKMRRSE